MQPAKESRLAINSAEALDGYQLTSGRGVYEYIIHGREVNTAEACNIET